MVRYQPQHKDDVRERILRSAGRQFRANGIAKTSVASVMREADLTHGGFYAYFQSKRDLVNAVVRSGFNQTSARFEARFDALEGDEWVRHWVRSYLSDGHLVRRDEGCPFTSVTAELSGPEANPALLDAFEDMFEERLEALSERIDAPPAEARRRLLAALAQMIGALMLARSLSESASRELREAAGDAAIRTLLGEAAHTRSAGA
ncbi:MAG: TetR/AcrR family transcriptional regulator [Planctomycetota bacterium]